MKKTIIWIIVAIVVIIGIVFLVKNNSGAPAGDMGYGNTPSSAPVNSQNSPAVGAPSTAPVPAVQTTQSSNGLSKYTNDELGFSVNYPTVWNVDDNPTGPVFTIPVSASSGKNTILTLSASITAASGKCTAPPVPASTIKSQSTVTSNGMSFQMYSVLNSTNTLNYIDRMYTLEQGSGNALICYVFTFGSIAATPASKNLSAAAATTALADNQTIITAADQAFTNMTKSFAVVVGPAGQSESAHPNGK